MRRCVPAFSLRIGAQTALCSFQSRRWHITEQYFATLQTPQRSVASLLQVDDEHTPNTRGAGAGGGAGLAKERPRREGGAGPSLREVLGLPAGGGRPARGAAGNRSGVAVRFLDVGANLGWFGFLAASLGAEI